MEATTAQASELERRVDLSIAIADVEKEMDQRLKAIDLKLQATPAPSAVPADLRARLTAEDAKLQPKTPKPANNRA